MRRWCASSLLAPVGNALHIRCSQCLTGADDPQWVDMYADTIYRGYALCLKHFWALRASEAKAKAASSRSQ